MNAPVPPKHVATPRAAARGRGRALRRKPADAYHHGDLRRALLAAAIRSIERHGVDALSLRAVAEQLRVSRAAPYRHFPSRAALIAALAEDGFRGLAEELAAAMDTAGAAPLARLRAGGVAYVRFATENPAHYSVMFGPASVDKAPFAGLEAAAARAFGLLVEAIRAGQRTGELRRGDALELALTAWAGVHGLAALIQSGQVEIVAGAGVSVEHLASGLATHLIDGLGRRAG